MATTFMNLNLPVPTVTLGPAWATQINSAFDVVDQHDHSSGKGVRIRPAGLNINDSLDFQNNFIANLQAAKYQNLLATLTGATNASSVYVTNGNLYFTNSSGTAVQITSGGAVVSTPGAFDTLQFNNLNANTVIAPSDAFVYIAIDTTAARTITLPLASSVSAGRVYIFKDASGLSETNNISIALQGSDTIDGETSLTVQSNYSTTFVIGNGLDAWYLV